MKTKTIAALVTGVLTLGQPMRAADNPATAPSPAASFEHSHPAPQTRPPTTLFEQDVSGVIPREIRGGDPLQMLNPFAPSKFGTSEENISLDPNVPGKGNGIKLFSISF